MKKNEKGITLISVIITVIIMTILASATTYYEFKSYKRTLVKKFVSQMQLVQTRVDEMIDLNEYSNLGASAEAYQNVITAAYEAGEITTNNIQDFKYFSTDSLKNQLDLENIDEGVLINFNTREVVSIVGIKYEGEKYYTQYKLPEGQILIQKTIDDNQELSFEIEKQIDGLNCMVSITTNNYNCTLSYAENIQNPEYNIISRYTKVNETYTVNIAKTGEYIFILQDNNEENNENEPEETTINIVLINKPKTNNDLEQYDYSDLENTDSWALTQSEDIDYIWIPRFAVNNDTGAIKFLKGNSNIATDNFYINNNDWTIPDIFSGNFEEYSGVWVLESSITEIEDIVNDSTIVGINEI